MTALRVPSNAEVVQLLVANFYWLRKLDPILIAVVYDGHRDANLLTWPGRLIAEKLHHDELECGLAFHRVPITGGYDSVINLGPLASGERIIGDVAAKERARQAYLLLLGKPTSIYEGYVDPDAIYPLYTVRAGYDPAVSHLLPLGYARQIIGDWNKRTEELKAASNEPATYQELKSQLFRVLLVRAECPKPAFEAILSRARMKLSSDVLVELMSNKEIRVGMSRHEFQVAAEHVLNKLRPGD